MDGGHYKWPIRTEAIQFTYFRIQKCFFWKKFRKDSNFRIQKCFFWKKFREDSNLPANFYNIAAVV